jgi:hypothetical protein
VERHGVGDGAVAVEEIGLEVALGEGEGHGAIVSQVGGVGFVDARALKKPNLIEDVRLSMELPG